MMWDVDTSSHFRTMHHRGDPSQTRAWNSHEGSGCATKTRWRNVSLRATGRATRVSARGKTERERPNWSNLEDVRLANLEIALARVSARRRAASERRPFRRRASPSSAAGFQGSKARLTGRFAPGSDGALPSTAAGFRFALPSLCNRFP